jgi:crotonobetainyl-CoA:carnitine CoA-transferase CaiB-like acyl-CoA transferase
VLKPMQGIRVLEVAQFTFVPSAGAVLADWVADVIKVEHAERGDAQRGLIKALGQDLISQGSSFAPIMDGPNRGKRSLGLSLEKPEAAGVLRELIKSSDVFLTNFLPTARSRLGIDVDSVRAINPEIIYAAGTGFAHSGPEADKGGYDGTAFWARGGSADTATPAGIVADIIASRTKDQWAEAFDGTEGQWAVVQNTYEAGHDPALRGIGQVADVVDAEGVTRQLVANPVQFNREAPALTRGPLFAEHTDEILRELGISEEEALTLKIAGAVT